MKHLGIVLLFLSSNVLGQIDNSNGIYTDSYQVHGGYRWLDADLGNFPSISYHDVGARASKNIMDIGLLNIYADYTGGDNHYGGSEYPRLGAAFVLPLSKFLSASFGLGGFEFTQDSFKQDWYSLWGDVFLHNIDYGKIGVDLSYSDRRTEQKNNWVWALESSYYRLYGSYYFDYFTVNAKTTLAEQKYSYGHTDSNATWYVSANLYPLDDTKLTIQGNIIDSNKRFLAAIEQQVFNNFVLGFAFQTRDLSSYWLDGQNYAHFNENTYLFKMIYHFGNKSSMKSRDRNLQQTGVYQ